MRITLIIMFGIIIFISKTTIASNFNFEKTSLSGTITNKLTGEVLPGVNIYITDLKTGTSSNSEGKYRIENLPQSKIVVQVSSLGYKLIIETIDLSLTTTKDFALEESVAELNEFVVTGLSKGSERNRTPTPISTISPIELQQIPSTNIIDAIATQPGVSQITTSTGISKPVIRGLGYNRVVVVNDGIRQEGQQWGDEHGVEVDEFSVNKVEILKGPASLVYGSDAMAGVINLITAPTLPEGNVTGNILGNYHTNNGLFGYSVNFNGNKKGFVWDIRYSNKLSHSYKNKYDGYVLNSGFKENTFGGVIGFNKSWGYSHMHFSAYHITPGIVDGERDSLTGEFLKPVAIGNNTEDLAVGTRKDFKSYTPLIPFQKVNHFKVVFNNSFVLGNGSVKAIIGWQQNNRKEYGDVLLPGEYGLYFLLNTVNYDIRYQMPEVRNINISFGVNGMHQASKNKGSEFIIPEYFLFDAGVFTIVKKSFEKLDISGGIRIDIRTEKSKDLFLDADGNKVDASETDAYHKFKGFNSTFSGLSGSVGATYQFSDLVFTKFNISRGFRAPNIAESGSNGEHEGSGIYEIGNAALKPENSLQYDYAIGLNSHHISAEANLFFNDINNFIYPGKLRSISGGDSLINDVPVYKFISGNASLYGGELSIDIHPHPLDWLHFENSISYVISKQKNQPDSTLYLPFRPAPKLTSEIRANIKKVGSNFKNFYMQFVVENYFTQDKYYAANNTETKTPGYTLFNFGIGTDVNSSVKKVFSIYISLNNLTDVAYQSHLSRMKYKPVNNLTGRHGVYNMGRNISFKFIVPINFIKNGS